MSAEGTGNQPDPEKGKDARKGRGYPPRHNKFDGANNDLKGHIFDLNIHGQVDKFPRTQEAIAIFVGSHLDPDIGAHIRSLTKPSLQIPRKPTREEMEQDIFLMEEYK